MCFRVCSPIREVWKRRKLKEKRKNKYQNKFSSSVVFHLFVTVSAKCRNKNDWKIPKIFTLYALSLVTCLCDFDVNECSSSLLSFVGLFVCLCRSSLFIILFLFWWRSCMWCMAKQSGFSLILCWFYWLHEFRKVSSQTTSETNFLFKNCKNPLQIHIRFVFPFQLNCQQKYSSVSAKQKRIRSDIKIRI